MKHVTIGTQEFVFACTDSCECQSNIQKAALGMSSADLNEWAAEDAAGAGCGDKAAIKRELDRKTYAAAVEKAFLGRQAGIDGSGRT